MDGVFLQSREWEEVQQSVGHSTVRVHGTLFIRHRIPGGFMYLYCPRPQLRVINQSEWLSDVYDFARRGGVIHVAIDPSDEIMAVPGMRITRTPPRQPRQTIVLDLTHSEDELTRRMHEKTRYNIRLAQRKGVMVTHVGANGIEVFWSLLQETAAREGFRAHTRAYYDALLKVRTEDFSNDLFFAYYRGKPVAAAMANFYRSPTRNDITATYLHGASSRDHSEVMAPHLLHWFIMQNAKQRGCTHYDLWGIDEMRWPGLTRFKKGFGGDMGKYPLAVDIIVRPWLYRCYRRGKKFFV